MDKKDLNDLFNEANTQSKEDFAFMRTSLLLVAGQHYNKTQGGRFFDRVRTVGDISNNTKIRLTKNHIGRIVRRIAGLILESAPNVSVAPKNEKEIQDQKTAEIAQAVWLDGKKKNDFDKQTMEFVDDFVGIGEVWTKLWFDPSEGAIVGYEQKLGPDGIGLTNDMVNEATGEVVQDPVPDESKPSYAGQIKFEPIYAFNVLVDPSCKDVTKGMWYCHRKMTKVKDLKKQFPDFVDKIDDSGDETFMIFDTDRGYRHSGKGEVMIREWFWKPCGEYPKGYYSIQLSDGIVLEEGELPEGIFPIECERYDYVQTKCRGVAATKVLRPYNIEINRAASSIAEAQLTLGQDKLVLVNGSKMSAGASLPGIRAVTVSGQAPMVVPGRSGEQYVDYMLSQIKEMYEVADLDMDEASSGNIEPHALLFRSASQKRKFNRYIQRFEGYLQRVCKLYLRMAKYYLDDSAIIAAAGSSEMVNISEFKSIEDSSLRYIVEPQAEDVETKLGRHLVIQNVLQYVGSQLDPSSIGQLITQMPYANIKGAFGDLTIDHESSTNDILALDRGEQPKMNKYDEHTYLIKKAVARMRQADFDFLPAEVQENYALYVQLHTQIFEEQKAALQRENSGFIPDSGAHVGVDMYVQNPQYPDDPTKTRRARIPQAAAEWLLMKLEEQGMAKDMLSELPDAVRQDMGGDPMAEAMGQEPAMPQIPGMLPDNPGF